MSRILIQILCALVVGWIVLLNAKTAHAENQHPSWGIADSAPIRFTVKLISTDSVGTLSLTEEALRNFVELKLRVNNIPIATGSAASSFNVVIIVYNISDVDSFVFIIQGDLTRPVTIALTGQTGEAKTWSTGTYVGTSSRDSLLQLTRRALESLVEKFGLDYLRANPR